MKKKPRTRVDNVIPLHLPRRNMGAIPEAGKPEDLPEDLNGPCGIPDEPVPMGNLAPPPQRFDPRYLQWVAGKTCCAPGCRSTKTVAHHWPAKGKGGRNGDDRMTVPLCSVHHDCWHDHARLSPFDNDGTRALFREVQIRMVLLYLDTECMWP